MLRIWNEFWSDTANTHQVTATPIYPQFIPLPDNQKNPLPWKVIDNYPESVALENNTSNRTEISADETITNGATLQFKMPCYIYYLAMMLDHSKLGPMKLISEDSSHKVYLTQKIHTKKSPPRQLFFKAVPQHDFTAELETLGANLFWLHAPFNAPRSVKVCRQQHAIVGVVTEGIPHYQPLAKSSLLEKHLKVPCLVQDFAANLLILERYDNEARLLNIDLETFPEKTVYALFVFNRVVRKITYGDLINYRIPKGLANGLVTSIALCEADGHRRNINKYGVRIDFDMLFWTIFCLFQKVSVLRGVKKNEFNLTPQEILDFPLLDAATSPFYWPCKTSISSSDFSLNTENAYSAEHSSIFKKLKDNAVFIFHKYKAFLKFILFPERFYEIATAFYLHPDIVHEGSPIAEKFCAFMQQRTRNVRATLTSMPAFFDYLIIYGEDALRLIKDEMREQNQSLRKKALKKNFYAKLLFDFKETENSYATIFKESMAQMIQQELKHNKPVVVFTLLLKILLIDAENIDVLQKKSTTEGAHLHCFNASKSYYTNPAVLRVLQEVLAKSPEFYEYLHNTAYPHEEESIMEEFRIYNNFHASMHSINLNAVNKKLCALKEVTANAQCQRFYTSHATMKN